MVFHVFSTIICECDNHELISTKNDTYKIHTISVPYKF